MHILEMQAAYGRLRGDSLRLEPGLNLIYAPNESGKSTWCSFIRTMLYGLPTRQSGPLADQEPLRPLDRGGHAGADGPENRRPALDGAAGHPPGQRPHAEFRLHLYRHGPAGAGGKRSEPGRDSAGRTPGGIPAQRLHRPERPGRQPGPGAGAPDRRPAVHGTGGRVLFRKL